jgi:lipase chaperone LimK
MVGKLIEKVVRYLTESSAYFAEEVRNAEYQIQSLQGYKDNLQSTIDSNNDLKKAVATLITEKEKAE